MTYVPYVPRLFTVPTIDTSKIPFDPAPDDAETTRPYVFDDDILVALDVAMATRRPLLVSGEPGTGKTTLARAMAGILDRRFLPRVVTSRTRLENITGDLDALRRLHHAQAAQRGETALPEWAYRVPGILWWAYDRESAFRRGADPDEYREVKERNDPRYQDPVEPGIAGGENNVVLLLDEIDKADPDVPNDLLEPMDSRRFHVFDQEISADKTLQVLVIITTNGERELPPAFLRRCVTLQLKEIDEQTLIKVARHHHGDERAPLYEAVAKKVMELREDAVSSGRRRPGTAEFLDAVRACKELELTPNSKVWRRVAESTLEKHIG
ncbi:MAG: MoxR family ATPase [Gammaproteobacteria bacterium]|jgi:MoxR-like ATPase|nr:MoxR family ATPase [Gammaproteobacteria bacterium]